MSSKGNPVILHIYDVPDANKYINLFTDKFGVFHTGVEVYKSEYSFGGHSHDYTGIFKTVPKDIRTLSVSDTFHYKEAKMIGKTLKTEEEVKQIVLQLGSTEFKGKNYHLIRKNCNHFSNLFCKKLCGKGIPEWINKMVQFIRDYPLLEEQIPQEFVTPKALLKDVKQKEDLKKRQKTAKEETKSDPKKKQKTAKEETKSDPKKKQKTAKEETKSDPKKKQKTVNEKTKSDPKEKREKQTTKTNSNSVGTHTNDSSDKPDSKTNTESDSKTNTGSDSKTNAKSGSKANTESDSKTNTGSNANNGNSDDSDPNPRSNENI